MDLSHGISLNISVYEPRTLGPNVGRHRSVQKKKKKSDIRPVCMSAGPTEASRLAGGVGAVPLSEHNGSVGEITVLTSDSLNYLCIPTGFIL